MSEKQLFESGVDLAFFKAGEGQTIVRFTTRDEGAFLIVESKQGTDKTEIEIAVSPFSLGHLGRLLTELSEKPMPTHKDTRQFGFAIGNRDVPDPPVGVQVATVQALLDACKAGWMEGDTVIQSDDPKTRTLGCVRIREEGLPDVRHFITAADWEKDPQKDLITNSSPFLSPSWCRGNQYPDRPQT